MDKFWNRNNEYSATNRVQMWLLVPYNEHLQAKHKGALWDPERKQWYVPHGVDVMLFRKWWHPHYKKEYRDFNNREQSSRPKRQREPRKPRKPRVKRLSRE